MAEAANAADSMLPAWLFAGFLTETASAADLLAILKIEVDGLLTVPSDVWQLNVATDTALLSVPVDTAILSVPADISVLTVPD
jgi:hypothetical protein